MPGPFVIATRRRSSTASRLLAATLLASLLGGCVETLPYSRLPELGKDPQPLLTPDQQKAAAAELAAKKSAKESEALKEIERRR